jgi:hypothetical protein
MAKDLLQPLQSNPVQRDPIATSTSKFTNGSNGLSGKTLGKASGKADTCLPLKEWFLGYKLWPDDEEYFLIWDKKKVSIKWGAIGSPARRTMELIPREDLKSIEVRQL